MDLIERLELQAQFLIFQTRLVQPLQQAPPRWCCRPVTSLPSFSSRFAVELTAALRAIQSSGLAVARAAGAARLDVCATDPGTPVRRAAVE